MRTACRSIRQGGLHQVHADTPPPEADLPWEQTPLGADTPQEQTPPRSRHTPTPPEQTRPLE